VATQAESSKPLVGGRLMIAGFVLALANFMVILDTTIANVSVPHIAGGLGISPSQGVWVITSYSVAEAITVPLTGWIAARFGGVRSYVFSLAGFAAFSFLCGMSQTLTMLVLCRVGQGICGGPLMPLTQTLMMRIFPKEQQGRAMGLWSMTVVLGPIGGPILGGWISDNWSWPWIFFINLPVAVVCVFAAWRMLRPSETPIRKASIDVVGMVLLVIWVGALQLMLDLGRERDWFASNLIIGLGLVAGIGFIIFLAWEATAEHPAVDLRVFRHRGFSAGTVSLALTFGTFFASVVILPQWLQFSMGYTATEAGYLTALNGVSALVMSPVVARLVGKVDGRWLVSGGMLWLAFASILRTTWNVEGTWWTFAFPQLLQGLGMPFFFIPLTTIALGSVDPDETASAAGLQNFLRTLGGAFAASVATTYWFNQTQARRSVLSGTLNDPEGAMRTLENAGFSHEQARGVVDQLVEQQGTMLSTNHIFFVATAFFVAAAMIIWLMPKPKPGAPGAIGAH
jgi:DHA2 family multidrug resistance protein